MTGPGSRTQELPRAVPAPSPRVVVYVLASAGAILMTVGVGLLAGLGWAFVVAGVMLMLGAVLLVDLPRPGGGGSARGQVRGQAAPPARPAPPPRPVFPVPAPHPQQAASAAPKGG